MAGSGRDSAVLVVLALALLAAADVATATTYQVGGGTVGQWTVPTPTNGIDYQTWANSHTFMFGDELVFNYQNDTHSVVLVNSTSYAKCITAGNIDKWQSGQDVIELTLGYPVYYFICGTPGHCQAGQKFHIAVSALATPPAASTTPVAALPPSGSPRTLPQIGILIFTTLAMIFCTTFLF